MWGKERDFLTNSHSGLPLFLERAVSFIDSFLMFSDADILIPPTGCNLDGILPADTGKYKARVVYPKFSTSRNRETVPAHPPAALCAPFLFIKELTDIVSKVGSRVYVYRLPQGLL